MTKHITRFIGAALLLLPFASFAADEMPLPEDYRTWVFLTASLDLDYDAPIPGAAAKVPGHSMLDNIFVNPEAYAVFIKTGTWPDKTVLVKENRHTAEAGSISTSGKYQTGVMSIELHVKDSARFASTGGWAFYGSDGKAPGRLMPATSSCFTCHLAHAAVDTTFVQFYPTLLDIAKAKGTLSASYVKAEAARAK